MKRSRPNADVLYVAINLSDLGSCYKYLSHISELRNSNIVCIIQNRFISVYKSAFDNLRKEAQISSHLKKWENIKLFNILFDHQTPSEIRLQFHSIDSFVSEDDDYELIELIKLSTAHCAENPDEILLNYLNSLEDQHSLRNQVDQSDGIAFVCNGSFLPSTSTSRYFHVNHNTSSKSVILPTYQNGNDSNNDNKYVPFISPICMQVEFILPHRGKVIGMLIPQGIVIIVGGGYHGKSTLLNALKMGVYDKHPYDGCEFVVSRKNTFSIRSEEGRYVGGIDISPFITTLPTHAKVDPCLFQTHHASGSTSMAANVMEVLEIIDAANTSASAATGTDFMIQATISVKSNDSLTTTTTENTLPLLLSPSTSQSLSPSVLLLDEDICANNFMVRDSRMRALVSHEPIIPFSYRVNGLYKQYNISSIIVVGGSGDWFDVQTCTILMDNYRASDMTKRANSISHSFCNGRVQYNGRGLVHQLPWPTVERPLLSSSFSSSLCSHLLTRSRYVDMSSVRSLFGIRVNFTPAVANKANNINNGNNKSSNSNINNSAHNTISVHGSSKSIVTFNDIDNSLNIIVKDGDTILSVQCDVQSISCSGDYSRIHYHMKPHDNFVINNYNNTEVDDESMHAPPTFSIATASSSSSIIVSNNNSNSNSNSSYNNSTTLTHKEVDVDLSSCDQLLYSHDSAMGLGYSLLYCFLYITITNELKKKAKRDEMGNKETIFCGGNYNNKNGCDIHSTSTIAMKSNIDCVDDTDYFVSLTEFMQVYNKLITSASTIDEFIANQSLSHLSTPSSSESPSILNSSVNLELYVGYLVYQMLNAKKKRKDDGCTNSSSSSEILSVLDICRQSNTNFVLALNRIRGLKFSYLDS